MTHQLPADIRRRMDDVNEQLKARQRELDAEAAAEQGERDRDNAATRAAYLKGLADKQAAEQATRDAAFEASIAPVRRVKMLAWLVDHPDKSEADFAGVWPHVKELLKIGDRDELVRREIEAQRRRY